MKYLKPWMLAENYGGEHYYDYYVVYGRHRDSGMIDKLNYDEIWETLEKSESKFQNNGEEDWLIQPSSSHWAVGWVESILLHKEAPQEMIDIAEDLLYSIEQYPILNEDKFSEACWDAKQEYWDNMPLWERVKLCVEYGANIFAARHDWWPEELDDYLEPEY